MFYIMCSGFCQIVTEKIVVFSELMNHGWVTKETRESVGDVFAQLLRYANIVIKAPFQRTTMYLIVFFPFDSCKKYEEENLI